MMSNTTISTNGSVKRTHHYGTSSGPIKSIQAALESEYIDTWTLHKNEPEKRSCGWALSLQTMLIEMVAVQAISFYGAEPVRQKSRTGSAPYWKSDICCIIPHTVCLFMLL
jgi:hypothetical protein